MNYQKTHPVSGAEASIPNLYLIRGYNRVQTRNSVLINAEIDIVDM